jgi:hypothetical protein
MKVMRQKYQQDIQKVIYTWRKNSQYSLDRRMGGRADLDIVERRKKSQLLHGIEPSLSNPQPSHYTDGATTVLLKY